MKCLLFLAVMACQVHGVKLGRKKLKTLVIPCRLHLFSSWDRSSRQCTSVGHYSDSTRATWLRELDDDRQSKWESGLVHSC